MKPFLKAGKPVDFTQKIVIDANVWVRYVAQQKHLVLLTLIRRYEFVVLCNNYLLHEIFNACITNKWYTEAEARKIISAIKTVVTGTTETAIFRLSKYPKDNYIFDLAIQNNCSFIVSDDRQLRETSIKPIPVKNNPLVYQALPTTILIKNFFVYCYLTGSKYLLLLKTSFTADLFRSKRHLHKVFPG